MLNGERCPTCGRRYHKADGRHISLTDEQIAAILKHSRTEQPKRTIRDYCKLMGISEHTYRLVAYMRLQQEKDIERVFRIDTKMCNENNY